MERTDVIQKFDENGRIIYELMPDPFGYGGDTESLASYDKYGNKVYEKVMDCEGEHERHFWYDEDKLVYQKNIEKNYTIEYTMMHVSDAITVIHEKFEGGNEISEKLELYEISYDNGKTTERLVKSMDIADTKVCAERCIGGILKTNNRL